MYMYAILPYNKVYFGKIGELSHVRPSYPIAYCLCCCCLPSHFIFDKIKFYVNNFVLNVPFVIEQYTFF